MRTSTVDNIRGRIYWLESVWDGRVTPTTLHHDKLADMKTFCTLEVKNEFDKISYNTLKNFCINHSFSEITHTSENLWEHMCSLRANIYSTFKKARTNGDIDKPTPEMKINEAYNQAQLASYAYLELFRFFKTLVESDTSLNYATKTQITNFLFESSLRFESINATPASPPKAWSVIQGGKGDA
ncbi:hypothetical protein D3C85_1234730 [compost metagenome]|jgi:hypothetical protein